MKRHLDPKEFGLPAKTVLEQVGTNSIALVIRRKSRLIMADGRNILEKTQKIKHAQPGYSVRLQTTAPVCSKTRKFLEEQGIEVISGE